MRLCPECGVPKRIVKEHRWLNDGTIVQSKDPDHRMLFIESEVVNGTFSGIEEIIGMSIERIITEAKRRATFDFIDHMLPGVVKAIVRVVSVRPVIRNVTSLGSVMGYGSIELASIRRVHGKGDYVTVRIREPYSLSLFSGDFAGTFNAIDRREVAVTYKETSPGDYEVTAHISIHPLELQERLQTSPYFHKEGDIELKRCPSCGGPKALSQYEWHPERGVIENRSNGRRMAVLGPASLEAIFDELEKELGENIPQVIVEAQRRFIKSGLFSGQEARDIGDFREQLAIRGLGNIKEFEAGEEGLHMRVENPCLHLMLAGQAQGLYELAFGLEGDVRWELAEDGDLTVDVSTRA